MSEDFLTYYDYLKADLDKYRGSFDEYIFYLPELFNLLCELLNSDLKKYDPPDPLAPYRFDKLKEAVKREKGKKAIVFHSRDVFSNPRDLLGFEKVLINLVDDPVFVRDLVEMSADYGIKLCRRALQEGADIVFSGDDIADNRGPLFNPALFRKIFLIRIETLHMGQVNPTLFQKSIQVAISIDNSDFTFSDFYYKGIFDQHLFIKGGMNESTFGTFNE